MGYKSSFFFIKNCVFVLKLTVNCAVSSVVEHYLHTVGVAGSKPAPRTSLRLNVVNMKAATPKRSVGGLHDHHAVSCGLANRLQNWSSFSLKSMLNVVSEP
jgi:hypothetical protein